MATTYNSVNTAATPCSNSSRNGCDKAIARLIGPMAHCRNCPIVFAGCRCLINPPVPKAAAQCMDACPTDAIGLDNGLELDMGRCLFCTECTDVCPTGAIRFTSEHRIAARHREDLIVRSGQKFELAPPLEQRRLRLFGRSLKLRVVSAGEATPASLT